MVMHVGQVILQKALRFLLLKPTAHLAILYANQGDLIASENRLRFSPPINADTYSDFFSRSRRCGSFKTSCDEIAQRDGLT